VFGRQYLLACLTVGVACTAVDPARRRPVRTPPPRSVGPTTQQSLKDDRWPAKPSMSGTNPPSSAGDPQTAAASARATQSLKRSVQAAFDGKIFVIGTSLSRE